MASHEAVTFSQQSRTRGVRLQPSRGGVPGSGASLLFPGRSCLEYLKPWRPQRALTPIEEILVARRFRRRRSFVAPPIITTSRLVSTPAAGGQPTTVPEAALDPGARMHVLLAALDNARSAKQELEAHHASEMLHLVVGLAHKAQTKAVAHDFLAWQKQLQGTMTKYEEAIAALEFGIEQFNSQIKFLLDHHPDEMNLALKEQLARWGESQGGLEVNEGTAQRKIATLRQLLARLQRKRKATAGQPGKKESASDGKR
jgi:hypothetical protein